MNIIFRVDASYHIGTGHVMRCLTLATALKAQGHSVTFICRLHRGNLIDFIEQQGFEVLPLSINGNVEQRSSLQGYAAWLAVSQLQDALDCKRVLNYTVDWLIVDHYGIDQTWQNQMKDCFRKLFVIDDLVNRTHICDALLDQTLGRDKNDYQACVPEKSFILTGLQYSLLREEFSRFKELSRKRRKNISKIRSILILMGGVDQDNKALKILESLDCKNYQKIEVVVGPKSVHFEVLCQYAASTSQTIKIHKGINNMAELMAYADLIVGAAGSTVWEWMCLGVPSLILKTAENQSYVVDNVVSSGVSLLIDESRLVDPQYLEQKIFQVEENYITWSNKAAQFVEGDGALKVVEFLERH